MLFVMTATRRLMLDLSQPLFAALAEAAAQTQRSLPKKIRHRLRKSSPAEPGAAKRSGRTEEQLLAPVRSRAAADVAQATGWADLQARLRVLGYAFRDRGGGIALHRLTDGQRMCKGPKIGAAYANLMRRFGALLTGHPHRHLVGRSLGGDAVAPKPRVARPLPPDWEDDDPILIDTESAAAPFRKRPPFF